MAGLEDGQPHPDVVNGVLMMPYSHRIDKRRMLNELVREAREIERMISG